MTPYYQDDSVTLYHGDCLEVTDWLSADVLVTDPPYGMKYAPRGAYNPNNGVTHQPRGRDSIAGDDSIDLRDNVLRRWYDRPWVVFGTWRVPRPEGTDHRLIWHKQGAPPGPSRAAFMLQDEEIYIHGHGFRATSPPMRSVIATDEMRSGAAGAVSTSIGVLLDPPYSTSGNLYAATNARDAHQDITREVQEWCEANEHQYRIVLCGFNEDHDELLARGWRKERGRAGGGAGYNTDGKAGRRERLWMSPPCVVSQHALDFTDNPEAV